MDGHTRGSIYCYGCGRDLSNTFKIPVSKGVICIDCLRRDVARKKEEYDNLYRTTENLTMAGIASAIVMIIFSAVTAVNQTEIFRVATVPFGISFIFWVLEMLSVIGFFFGVKTVFRWVSTWPIVVIVFSVLFLVLFF